MLCLKNSAANFYEAWTAVHTMIIEIFPCNYYNCHIRSIQVQASQFNMSSLCSLYSEMSGFLTISSCGDW